MNKLFPIKFQLLFGLLALFIASCSQTSNKENSTNELFSGSTYVCLMRCEGSDSHKPGKCPVCNMMLVKSIELDSLVKVDTHTDQSVYKIDYRWTDQDNKKSDLQHYKGKYQLVSMIFTHCEYACPNLIGDMLNIDDNLNDEKKDMLNFLLISIDPERDTPKRLASYAEDMDLEAARWSLLNGDVNAVNALSTLLGVSYKKFENGAYGHSNVISLLNQNGEIIYQLEGIHADKDELVNLINNL